MTIVSIVYLGPDFRDWKHHYKRNINLRSRFLPWRKCTHTDVALCSYVWEKGTNGKHVDVLVLVWISHKTYDVAGLQIKSHDDVIRWKHFPRYWPFVRRIHRSPMNSPPKSQWCVDLMFPLICALTNSWANNREAGDLRCHRANYDVTVMCTHEIRCQIAFTPYRCDRRHGRNTAKTQMIKNP